MPTIRSMGIVGGIVAAFVAFAGFTLWLLGGHDLPSTAEIRKAAANLPDRSRTCENLRRQLGPLPTISRAEAELRIQAAGQEPDKTSPPPRLDLRFADLEGAKLNGAKLGSADLAFARLRGASLEGAVFSDANLSCADLTQARGNASFRAAVLTGALLIEADLQKSAFTYADLQHANLTNAVLKDADMGSASLVAALLVGTDLDKANLTQADLQYADYRPVSAPRAIGLKNLGWTFPRAAEFAGLSMLRKSLLEVADNSQARIATYAIESWRDDHHVAAAAKRGFFHAAYVWATTALRRLGFDWTVAYGANPSRALLILLWSGLVFAAAYWVLIRTPFNSGDGGLFRVLPKGSLVVGTAGSIAEASDARIARVGPDLAESVPAALWFSALSATRFGYGSFTLSSWLGAVHLSQDEYRALRLFRTLSGLQALVSLYLLVLFVITLFGDPFSLWP